MAWYYHHHWDKVCTNQSKLEGVWSASGRSYNFKFFKGCRPQILLSPLSYTLFHLKKLKLFPEIFPENIHLNYMRRSLSAYLTKTNLRMNILSLYLQKWLQCRNYFSLLLRALTASTGVFEELRAWTFIDTSWPF